ncbi:hypothetical protein PTNB73_08597 [Pyrenophora teres f. teres]|uniref:Uncharacterized protein n=2 Tax=Pyrenophora teres f. teres TaxID=97479 RepID=E3RF69_PYRTT|nr:hypothetical protein PTT_05733 [Pyrenophora teres f. teres 0-1]KAE8825600.1 hypothetical protein HRS9139_08710 [Pyrenophora teres f. teres]KAE8834697.1 hypothetical protein PTNB85_06030 [Pyrenophora teres f. teres]KAE8843824.1 hypothetical protein HRS9122_04927 [Pyrenophora teres f. teres]KAE8859117.1 hypothetical protein PTNB73_08597 [Pyrenophora teres f. teres]
MSRPDQAELAVETTRTLKRKHLAAADQEDLDALDTIFKRIKTVIPRAPYILSTPSVNPYRYHSQQQANAWMIGRLFRHDEEHLQYRTYWYREPCQDCFELQAGEEEEPEPELPRSQPSNRQPAKKKPNLSAFKVKPANGTSTPGVKISSPSLSQAKKPPPQANRVGKSDTPPTPAAKPQAKSPRPTSNAIRDERRADKIAESRPRASTQKSESAGPKIIEKSDPSNCTPHGLPPLLSPVHEPLGNPYGLPNLLSPTLPANVQAELDRLEVQRKRAESDASTSSSSDPKNQTLAVPPRASQKSNGTPNSEGRVRSGSVNGKSPNPEPVSHAKQTDPSMVVKLKFSKTKAPVVGQILRLPSKRANIEKKERSEAPKAAPDPVPRVTDLPVIKKKPAPKVAARRGETTIPVPASMPSTSAKPSLASAKPAEKRTRPEEDSSLAVPPAKRPRASSMQDRPITPVQNVLSPAMSTKGSAQKNQTQYATPKKDIKSVNMLRSQSSESNDTTPGRSGATPAGGKLESRVGPTSAPLNSKKQADIALLGHTSAKLNQMGRALKHEATKILTGGKITKQEEKRAAVTNLECILAYMAAYFAQDVSLNLRGRAGEVEQTWKTLLPLCLSYSRCTKDFQHLDGLRCYLSSVIASAICTHVSQRSINPKSHDSPQDVNHAEVARQHNSIVENFALLADHTIKKNRHFQDATIALPWEDLQSMYKKTYAGRETNIKLIKEPEKVSGARMSGPYFLPLGTETTPIQAVRFGLKFLSEYCEREKLDYHLRVNLDRPE